ncbi:hypothetical protein OHS58_09715 [Amycolatopsis sp. NBC_00348]|uniref:hypothetical protein n=1 Tax=Amycolatopsis sp. NBC_00348 TaxID=2975956 RepID=UPI002E256B5C
MLADEDGQGEAMPTIRNREHARRSGRGALITIKVVHTLVWLSVESCVAYLLYAGFAKRSDRRAAIAGAVVTIECTVFIANGLRCPLTDVAESLGDDHGSVTDIYLPPWLARNLPAIHVPLVILTIVLHLGNLRRRASRTTDAATPARTFRAAPGPPPPPGVARPDPVHCCTRRA